MDIPHAPQFNADNFGQSTCRAAPAQVREKRLVTEPTNENNQDEQPDHTYEGRAPMRERQITRRDLVRGGAAFTATVGLPSLLAACGGSGGPTAGANSAAKGAGTLSADLFPDLRGQTITMVTYGGTSETAMIEAYAKPFSERTGLKILQDAPVDYAKLKAMVEANNVTWDVIDGDPNTSVNFCRTGLIEPLNPVVLKGIDPKYYAGKCCVPTDVYAAVLSYDKTKFGDNPPSGWVDFFDTVKYPGKRGLWSVLLLNQLEMALLGDGVSPAKLYPLDISRAIAKLNTIKDDIVFFSDLGPGGEQMVSQQVVMTNIDNARGYSAAREGAPFSPAWNQAILAWECYEIPKGSPHKAAAEAFIRYMGTAAAQARVANSLTFGSTAEHPLPDKGASRLVLEWLPTPTNTVNAVTIDPKWWADNYNKAVQAYTTWASS